MEVISVAPNELFEREDPVLGSLDKEILSDSEGTDAGRGENL
jgi:hypothetical protein